MISVGSYPELYDTLIGWQQYENIWSLLTQTGLVYVPFIIFFCKEWLDSAVHHHNGIYLIRKTLIHFFIAVCTIQICLQPSMPLDASVLQFTPVCNVSGQGPATPGNTGTTYDQTTPIPQNVKVPLFWYGVMDLSHGMAIGAASGLTCMPDLRQIQTTVNTAEVTDPVVKQQISQFYQDCYRPALTKYLAAAEAQNPNNPGAMDANIDIQWMGSTTFLNTAGYYDSFSATSAVTGFPYNPTRDYEYGQYHGQWGRPTCQEWWSDSTNGLQQAIKGVIKPTMWQDIQGLAEGDGATVAAEKTIISNSIATGYQNLGDEALSNHGLMFTGVLPAVGEISATLTTLPKYYELISALPIIQSNILMGLYLLIALMVPLSGYKLSAVFSFAMGIFSVTFWTYLFQVAAYKHFTVTSALFPPDQFFSSTQAISLELIDLSLYIGLPFLMSMTLSWAGYKAGFMADTMLGVGSASVAEAGAGGAGKMGGAAGSVARALPILIA
jgi:hypothetical protein